MTTIRTSFDPSGVKASLAEFGTPTGTTNDGDVNISGEFKVNGAPFGGTTITSAAMKTWVLTLPTTETADDWWLNGNVLCYGAVTP